MAEVAIHPEVLKNRVAAALGEKAKRLTIDHGELTVHVAASHYLEAMQILRDAAECRFEQPVSYTHLTLPTIYSV